MHPTRSHEQTGQPQVGPPHVHVERRPRFWFRLAGWIVPERNPSEAIYGLITIGALLAAESGLRETYPETVGSATIAVVLYWFAHAYADVLGLRLSEQRHLTWEELWRTFVRDWAIVKGAGVPLLALLVAWAVGASQAAAVTAGVWTAVGGLIAFEVAAGIRSRAKPAELVLQVAVGVTMGLAILALRALLH
jgi:signal transduction histidine kinase